MLVVGLKKYEKLISAPEQGRENVPESAVLVGADLPVVQATLRATDTVTASLGHRATLESVTTGDL